MFKRITAICLVFMLLLCSGCSKKETAVEPETQPPVETPVEPPREPELYVNPLTGVKELEAGIAERRPVAVMVNNFSSAQKVQTGVTQADVIYETEIEGGITRLLAVFQDISKVKTIGTIRSARYAFIDLAMGHNAVYIHHGRDPVYALPHLSDVDRIEIQENLYGERLDNGLKYEHTLYTYGEPLWKGITDRFNTQNTGAQTWQNFAAEDQTVTLTDGVANVVTIPFSGNYKTKFVYDSTTGLYERNFNATIPADYFSGESTKVKNVVVMLTTITDYPDGLHRNIRLQSGEGYYATNGGYKAIKWSKGGSSDSVKFTNLDGTPLQMSAGTTWVCVASKNYANPLFE